MIPTSYRTNQPSSTSLLYIVGMLPLTFVNASDYDKITGKDKVTIVGLDKFVPGKNLTLRVKPASGGAAFDIPVAHTFNEQQIKWFEYGSALNYMKAETLK